jgi:pyruvate dehydrogenase E2 component (dihydrolipoyllysine-residue acetyltransferase)
MAVEVKLPQFGMGMREATILRWYKSVGDAVTKGDPLLEVEAEKAVNEIVAPASGVLASIIVHADAVAHVYQSLGTIAEPGELPSESTSEKPTPADSSAPAAPLAQSPLSVASSGSANEENNATPRARRLARELGIELASIRGTGPNGRVTDDDVRLANSNRAAGAPDAS